MDIKGNTILITGGSNGIGLALAERFLKNGNDVIVCGRREDKLKDAKERFPQLHTRCCDVGDEAQRTALYEWVVKEFPNLNILVNNAGIQRKVNLKDENIDWNLCKQEMAINLEAPLHLSMLFMAHLSHQKNPAIINVSSDLAFMPSIWVPVYGATKAGVHSFTFSLRQQLADANFRVVEIIPPATNTDLGGKGLHTHGVDVNEFADAVWNGLENGAEEISFGSKLEMTRWPRPELESRAIQVYKQRMAKENG